MIRSCFILVLLLALHACSKPVFVTHWDGQGRALVFNTRKLAYGLPKHSLSALIVCRNSLCRARAERLSRSTKHKFKGYKKKNYKIRENIGPPAKPIVKDSMLAAAPEIIVTGKAQVFEHIYFAFGKSELLEKSFPELDKLVITLIQNEFLTISITGHTDNKGDSDLNQKLSEERAKAVAFYLNSKGVLQNRIEYNGSGSKNPIADNTTEEGQRKNRRVEFILERL